MNDKKGEMLMLPVESVEAELLTIMGVEPYVFDNNKRVIFLIGKEEMKILRLVKRWLDKNATK